MTIAVGILGAVLGIVIGILVMRVKGAQRDAECKQSGAELEKQLAVLQSQLNAETEKLHAARETAENQLAEVKAEAEKRIADEKDAAAALRWHMRGLDLRDAIRKVQVDAEVRQNAIGSRA